MPRSSPNRYDVDGIPHRGQKAFQVGQVQLHQAVEECVGTIRVAGQQHQEVVDAIKNLPDLQQVASEEPDNRTIRPRAGDALLRPIVVPRPDPPPADRGET